MIVVRGIGIDKNFGAEPVLSQCSISLQKGEIYGLVGINGAGKTTLMKILLGLQRPDEGIVELFGKEASVSGMLDRVGLYHARKKPVSSYSLGMKQRLGFARALIHRPELLVLDEPLNGMDPVVAAEMIQMLKEAAQNGAAILLSSHMLGEMRKTADRIGVLTGGCIRREITEKEEIRDHPQEMEEELVTLMRGGVTNEKTV